MVGEFADIPLMTANYLYHLYGLVAASDLQFPELPGVDSCHPDISFRFGKVRGDGLKEGGQIGPFHWAAPGKMWLEVPGIARYLVSSGKEILIDPFPGVDEDSLRVFLLSACMGVLLMQRELLVLRGCAVRIGDGCMLCLGASASGKSTLAAALMQRGQPILADDVVAIDAANRVIPGFPDIKLWCDAAQKLEIPTANLRRTRQVLEKYHLPLAGLFQSEPMPVKWIFELQSHNRRDFLLEDINGMERFATLLGNSYRPLYLDAMGCKAGYLKQCAALSGKVDMKRLFRPEAPLQARELADFILEDICPATK